MLSVISSFLIGKQEPQDRLELVYFNELPLNSWFRHDHKGQPTKAVSKKVSQKGSIMGNQFRIVEELQVWWDKNPESFSY